MSEEGGREEREEKEAEREEEKKTATKGRRKYFAKDRDLSRENSSPFQVKF